MKRVLSLLLTLVMVFSLIPVAAFADGNAAISFETTFAETMTVGDTFTVTANLANNPGMATMTVSLKWNEDAVKFNGFETEYDEDMEEDVLVTDVFKSVWEPVVNYDLGIITASRTKNTTKSGTLFVANFEIVGSGDLEIALKDADATEFEMANADMEDIAVTFDYSAIANLSVAAPEPEGPTIPVGAPFTAVTTDKGNAIAVEKWDDLSFDPYGMGGSEVTASHYHITIPAGATEAYVKFNMPVDAFMEQDYMIGEREIGSNFSSVNHDDLGTNAEGGMAAVQYGEDSGAAYTNIIIPLEFAAGDFSGSVFELPALKTDEDLYYAVGPQDASGNIIALFSLEYGEAGGDDGPTTYDITIEQTTGGTVTVMDENLIEEITEAEAGDYIFLTNAPEEGYRFKHYLINDVEVTETALGMTNGFYQIPAEDITVSGVFEAIHTCSYDQENVADEYLKSEATCQSGAVYYKSCECGEAGTETFVSGGPVGCVYENGVCKWCSATEPILSFTASGQTLEAVTAEEYCSEYDMTAQKLTVTVPAGVNTVTINCAASMCAYIDHVSSDLSSSGKSAEIDLTQDLTFVCVPVTLDDGSDAYYHVYFEQKAGDVDPEPEDPVVTLGYSFATSADVSAENGGNAVVSVKITGHSDRAVTTYNAYDLTLTFDSGKLELAKDEEGKYIYSGAVKSDNGSVTVEGNTIRIVGCGATKGFGTEIATLTFKTLAEGAANVTISQVQVSDKDEAVTEDIPAANPEHAEDDPAADETPNVSVIVVPYTVTKLNFVSGNDKVLHGEDYTFYFTDTDNYTYSGLTVTMGGEPVDVGEPVDGVYTIENVTGAIEITATQTANTYDVTIVDGGATVEGAAATATYGTDYTFTVTAADGKDIETVKVTKTADASAEISYTIHDNGAYVIAGTSITADFTIIVTQKDEPVVATTTITFAGVEETEVEGGLTQTAEIGKAFTFRLNKAEGFTYTAKVGETDLVETEAVDETPAYFTIPAELVVEGGVTVTITKTEISNLKVEVSPYFNADGATMFLVIAKDGEKALAYGENAMFYSSRYALTDEEAGAYCRLVSSSEELNDAEAVRVAAEAAIQTASEETVAPTIAYDFDVNQTTKVDVNDAQLAYDMYNGEYMVSESVTMDKFLEADMSTDKKLDVNDVAAIINYIVNGNNA